MQIGPDLSLYIAVASVLLRTPDDRDLITRLQQRDGSAMGELYDRYGRLVYTVVLKIVRDPGAAEDLVQECFLRVWNRATIFDAQRGALGVWLATVARNQAVDYLRSVQSRTRRDAGNIDLERIAATLDSAEDRILHLTEVERVRAALLRLSDKQQELVHLAYYEGLSQSQMAERLKQPLGTVKTSIRAALKKLRLELQGPVQS